MSRVVDWLCEAGDPSIRYRALVELLDLPAQDPRVQVALQAIPRHPPLSALLASQKPQGYWVKPDFYVPKHYSTFLVLALLADLGLTKNDEHIRRGGEFMFAQQRPDGGFCRLRRTARSTSAGRASPTPG